MEFSRNAACFTSSQSDLFSINYKFAKVYGVYLNWHSGEHLVQIHFAAFAVGAISLAGTFDKSHCTILKPLELSSKMVHMILIPWSRQSPVRRNH